MTGTLTRTGWELRFRDGAPPLRGDVRTLAGTRPRSAVVVCHGFKGFRKWGFFPALAREIALAGHAAVSFDFAMNGVGEDGVDFSALHLFKDQTHSRNVAEIRAVLRALRSGGFSSDPPQRIGLFGHSRGGGEAVLAVVGNSSVDALVTWAAISEVDRWSDAERERWRRGRPVTVPNARTGQDMPVGPAYWQDLERNRSRLDIRAAAAGLSAPWLIIHGGDDDTVDPAEGRALHAAAPRSELLLVEGGSHTFGAAHPFTGPTPELRRAARATLDWFGRYLG
ncbi:MAG: alpha/beta hydrolase family protein [Longimicrobiaceae bacterium]